MMDTLFRWNPHAFARILFGKAAWKWPGITKHKLTGAKGVSDQLFAETILAGIVSGVLVTLSNE